MMRRIDRQADTRERALEFVADRERGRIDRVVGDIAKGVVDQPVRRRPVRDGPGTDDVPDQGRPRV